MEKLKVLIAEDDAVSRRLMEASVTNWGHEAVCADDGEQARALLQAGGIHICILDWEMPRMNGIELCQWIRFAHLTPKPYIIMLTCRREQEHVHAAYAAGVHDFISKPFDRDELRLRISQVIEEGLPRHGDRRTRRVASSSPTVNL